MSNEQLYFSIGVPAVMVLVGVLINATVVLLLNPRISHLETRLGNLDNVVNVKFDLLIGEIDSRLSRLEERLAR